MENRKIYIIHGDNDDSIQVALTPEQEKFLAFLIDKDYIWNSDNWERQDNMKLFTP